MSQYFSRLKALELVSALSAIFGIVGTCFGIWSFFNPVSRTALFYDIEDKIIYRGSSNFDLRMMSQGVSLSTDISNIHESRIVLWNEGRDTLAADEMRKPLVISAGSQRGAILDLKILNVRSVIDDNFKISRVDDRSYELSWKKFDPGMAVSLAALHIQSDDLVLIGAFGPKYQLSKFPPWGRTFAKGAIVAFGTLLAFVCGLISVEFFNRKLHFMDSRFGFPPFAFFLTVGFALGGGIGFGLFWLLSLAMNFYPPTI